ncbi:MAG: hypothetical protein N5P05_004325 (plasmid) [Chroococcopsis gigantea SAG 12.99]|jgi:hypothetical protein|nr:hypothetical protein [Chroococcopsis gigantea SAG 12.99]MDV3002670.1 hypothetical protein [Chroococcopsis gigantea SAG 12.99]
MTRVNSASLSVRGILPLSVSLQNGFCFFTHPLPPKDLDFDYSRFTKEFDYSLDFVGLTLFYQLKFHDVVRMGIYFTIGFLFLRCYERKA